ncbi:hypothetical protein EG68_02830, partial [Paragonimus skrjabini miyazakii]
VEIVETVELVGFVCSRSRVRSVQSRHKQPISHPSEREGTQNVLLHSSTPTPYTIKWQAEKLPVSQYYQLCRSSERGHASAPLTQVRDWGGFAHPRTPHTHTHMWALREADEMQNPKTLVHGRMFKFSPNFTPLGQLICQGLCVPH